MTRWGSIETEKDGVKTHYVLVMMTEEEFAQYDKDS